MKQPDIAAAEVAAGRGTPLPDYVDEILVARYLGIPPWELQDVPYYWYRATEIVMLAQHEAEQARARTHGHTPTPAPRRAPRRRR